VTLLFVSGEKVDAPFAVKVFPVATVSAPLTVVVPEPAPREIAVAAPPISSV